MSHFQKALNAEYAKNGSSLTVGSATTKRSAAFSASLIIATCWRSNKLLANRSQPEPHPLPQEK